MIFDGRTAVRAAWAALILAVILTLIAAVLAVVNRSLVPIPESAELSILGVVMGLTFPPVGLLVLKTRPRHLVGWIFAGIGLGQSISLVALQYAFYTLHARPGALPLAGAAYWLESFVWFPSFCLMILLLAVFPTGQPLPGRWRWLNRLVYLAMLLNLISRIVEPLTDPETIRFTPPPVDSFGIGDFIYDTSVELMMVTLVAAVISVIVRLRRSRGVERQQMKWFTSAGLVIGVVFIGLVILSVWPVLNPKIAAGPVYQVSLGAVKVLFPLTVALIPIAVGAAVMRYRLYGIDLIIRRTLVYTLLTVLFALVYTVVLVLAQALLSWVTLQASSELAVVLSTLTIAVIFAPVRTRIQESIDRRFYRSRYDAEKALHAFSAELRKELDLEAVLDTTLKVIDETIQPANLSILLVRPSIERVQVDPPAVQPFSNPR